MPRRLCYDLAFSDAPAGQTRLVIRLALGRIPAASRGADARDMANRLPIETLMPALRWLAAMGYLESLPTARLEGSDIVLPLKSARLTRWHFAILLNMIDFAFAESEPALKLATSVTVATPGAGAWTQDAVFDDLATRMETARANLTDRLPPNTFIDEYTLGEWPASANLSVYLIDRYWLPTARQGYAQHDPERGYRCDGLGSLKAIISQTGGRAPSRCAATHTCMCESGSKIC